MTELDRDAVSAPCAAGVVVTILVVYRIQQKARLAAGREGY
jgi:hypothetical protein